MINVLLVDDQHIVRQGIASLLNLSDEVLVLAEAESGEAALTFLAKAVPDIVLMDIRMPGMNGVETLIEMRERNIHCPTILLTSFEDTDLVQKGLAVGAVASLLKDVTIDELLRVIKTYASNGQKIRAKESPDNNFNTLTPRESQVLRLISQGLCNKEIATQLGLSTGTVKNHTSNIFSKLGVRDRIQAALKYNHHS
ncbi:MAG: response regulator transcription factor [Pseudomonadales bacterium]|uniref:Two component LuxR family transcriptional regulator n=1 Tax=Oleiphilus messinensis TaxID=141451 RepID=A0A1Y0IFG7_9GAMM|nr:response regulator transcription factor [Oleiphilus messinensis]ARU58123.1 two component LuxR family transcriptional regulator [Oleiphilus messinensis]MCG8609782.1 response regulator transcription factor [Pseudomonadales bacterium]